MVYLLGFRDRIFTPVTWKVCIHSQPKYDVGNAGIRRLHRTGNKMSSCLKLRSEEVSKMQRQPEWKDRRTRYSGNFFDTQSVRVCLLGYNKHYYHNIIQFSFFTVFRFLETYFIFLSLFFSNFLLPYFYSSTRMFSLAHIWAYLIKLATDVSFNECMNTQQLPSFSFPNPSFSNDNHL